MSQSLPKMPVSLSFSKRIEKKSLKSSAIGSDSFQNKEIPNRHSITSFDKCTKPLEVATANEIVIPLVESKRDAIFDKLKQKSKPVGKHEDRKENEAENQNRVLSLDEQAAAAVLKECSQKLEEIDSTHQKNGLSILVNAADSVDVNTPQTAGHISTLHEYDQVNVDCFGAAMLRGMGWKKGKGIGKQEKIVEIVTPTSKMFGQIDTKRTTKKEVEGNEEEEELKKGSLVLVHSGRNIGTYGLVEAVDEDHLLIRPAKDEIVLREVEQNVRIVSAKEYKEFSRVINKEMYDEYKAAENKKGEKTDDLKDSRKRRKDDSERREHHDKRYKDEDHRKDKKRSNDDKHKAENYERREMEPPLLEKEHLERRDAAHTKAPKEEVSTIKKKHDVNQEIDQSRKEVNKGHKAETGKEARGRQVKTAKTKMQSNKCDPPIPVIPWARENLRVRIIDKLYQRGIYHKEKVIVRSVETVHNCTCVSDDGKILYDVDPDHLETVIPKAPGAIVLVVKGKFKGQKGQILELDKCREQATLQFLSDKSVLMKLHYDYICELISR